MYRSAIALVPDTVLNEDVRAPESGPKVLRPFVDGKQLWLGLEEEGFRRKVNLLVSKDLGAKHLTAGLTIFPPGERCALHAHPGSEEVNIVIKGRGVAYVGGVEMELFEGCFVFIPEGMEHQHYNNGDEPLVLAYVYGPPGELPTR
jgi:quercetin dioxygenase-like cupin family protein